MDEEQEILQSSLEQSDKISIGSFFGSPIGGLANRAISQSNTSLKSSITNRNLIATLQASIQLLRGQLQQITNYVLVDQQERKQILQQRETEAFEREDAIQKGIIGQSRNLEDVQPFFPENRFSQGLTAGMSSIGDPKGVAKFQQDVLGIEAEGSKSFRFGGFVTGSGNADTINAKLTPGEFVVPKNVVENLSPSFFKGLISSGKKDENVKSNGNSTDDSFNLNTSISYSTRGNPETGEIEVDPNSLEYPFMLEGATQQFYQDKVEELESEIFDAKLEAKVGGYKPDISHLEEELNKYKGKYDDTLEYGTRYNVGGDKRDDSDDKKGGFFKNLFGSKKNENVKSDDKKGGFFKNLFGSKKNENVKSDDKKGRDLFGIMGGTIDALTGNLTDLDKKGGKPFGLMRGITGSIDAMTGGLTDLDRRGGKPFGTMRLATGVADAMTGNLFDFDRRGDGKSKSNFDKEGNYIGTNERKINFYAKKKELKDLKSEIPMDTTVNPDGSITSKGSGTFSGGKLVKPGEEGGFFKNLFGGKKNENVKSEKLTRKDFKSDEDFEFYKNNFGDLEEDSNKINQLPMKTTVNPDGSITSKGSGTLIGGELVKPGQPLSENQKAVKALGSLMGDKELTKGFSTYPSKSETPSIEPANESNLKVDSSESIKTAAQGLMTPPPPPQSETIELPPQIQGGGGGGNSIPQAAPSFSASTPSHDPLTGTESTLIFVEVISNPFLSIP